MKQQNYFLSQPHQPFFILGIINAILMMLIFALEHKGILSLELDMITLHVYSLSFLLFCNVFTGFLFTTFPRFNQTGVIEQTYYTNIFYANTIGSILFILGNFISFYLVLFAMILLFISQVMIVKKLHTIYKAGLSPDKSDSFWILTANYFGLAGHALFISSLFIPQLLNLAISISFYLYLVFLAFSVGQRMIPFFSHSFAQKDINFVKVVFSLFVAKVIFSTFDIKILEIMTDIALSGYMLREFLKWELHPFKSPSILWVLHLALFWLPTAFAISAITLIGELFLDVSFYFLNIHLLALGFLTTVLIGFGTRVTLGHSGQAPNGDAIDTKIFYFIQIIVLLRTLYSLNIALEWNMEFLFDISFSAWLILFLTWGGRYAKTLIFRKQG